MESCPIRPVVADTHRYAPRSGVSAELAELISPISHVDAASAPILLIHSKADQPVPHETSVNLIARYKEAGAQAELVSIEDAPPAFWNMEQCFADTTERSPMSFQKHLVETEE